MQIHNVLKSNANKGGKKPVLIVHKVININTFVHHHSRSQSTALAIAATAVRRKMMGLRTYGQIVIECSPGTARRSCDDTNSTVNPKSQVSECRHLGSDVRCRALSSSSQIRYNVASVDRYSLVVHIDLADPENSVLGRGTRRPLLVPGRPLPREKRRSGD